MDQQTSLPHPPDATVWDQVRALRRERGETGEQFGAAIGLSKSKVSELEAGKYPPSVGVALEIEALSGGRIDAAALCEDVRKARHGLAAIATPPGSATGLPSELSGAERER